MMCKEKACVWQVYKDGLCKVHYNMFIEDPDGHRSRPVSDGVVPRRIGRGWRIDDAHTSSEDTR